jgi:hypothetical protein
VPSSSSSSSRSDGDLVLREARTWFIREFHPDTIADVKAALASEHNPKLRRTRFTVLYDR